MYPCPLTGNPRSACVAFLDIRIDCSQKNKKLPAWWNSDVTMFNSVSSWCQAFGWAIARLLWPVPIIPILVHLFGNLGQNFLEAAVTTLSLLLIQRTGLFYPGQRCKTFTPRIFGRTRQRLTPGPICREPWLHFPEPLGVLWVQEFISPLTSGFKLCHDKVFWIHLFFLLFLSKGYGVSSTLDCGNSKAYLGFGAAESPQRLSDWWEFDMSTSAWRQLADFPGEPRRQ